MDPAQFQHSPSGRPVRTPGGYWAFVPNPLPPKLDWDSNLVIALSTADMAIGTVSGLGETLPNPHLLIYPFIRREAVLSSRIEGTRSSLSDLLFFEATSLERQGDVREVQNYVRAMEYGLQRIGEIPLSLRLIREIHAILLQDVRGEHATAGEFRHSQNWIGPPGCILEEATYIPPPVPEMQQALDGFEKFLHAETGLPTLVEMALIHYQFEAIHPFLDGNGRIGRLLVALLLCQRGVLAKPLLYLSAFFERHRQEYYDLLLAVSRGGEWREWLTFFLRAVAQQSKDAIQRSRRLLELHRSYAEIALDRRWPPSAGRLTEVIFMKPVLTMRQAERSLKVSFPTARNAIDALEEAGVLVELTGGRRNRAYAARDIVAILEEEMPDQ